MINRSKIIPKKDLTILTTILLLGLIIDRIWFNLNQEIPNQDQAYYLNSLMDYWQLFTHPEIFNLKWWNQWLILSSQTPPLLYISTLPLCLLFGTSINSISLILTFYSAILLLSIYGLGRLLFNRKIALFSAFLCQVIPLLYYYRLNYHIAYPSTALITCTLFFLTIFYFNSQKKIKILPNNKKINIFTLTKDCITKNKPYFYKFITTFKPEKIKKIKLKKYIFYLLSKTHQDQTKKQIKLIVIQINQFIINSIQESNFKYAILSCLSLSCALLINQNSLTFLLIPIVFIFLKLVFYPKIQAQNLCQLIISILIFLFLTIPWYKANWLILLFFNQKNEINQVLPNSTFDFTLLTTWYYYLTNLPFILSWVIFLLPIIYLIFYGIKNHQLINFKFAKIGLNNFIKNDKNQWLIIIFVGSYLLLSLPDQQSIINFLPLLPLLALIIVAIIKKYQLQFKPNLEKFIIIITSLIMLGNIFPLPISMISKILSPHFQYYPIFVKSWPAEEIINTVINTHGQLKNNIGFLNENKKINVDHFSFFGRQNKLGVIAHNIQSWGNNINLEKQALDWFLVQDQSSNQSNYQTQLLFNQLKNNAQFEVKTEWLLKDQNKLKLYHRLQPLIEVKEIDQPSDQVELKQMLIPLKAPPGLPIPVTYEWRGKLKDLADGIVLLTWINTEKINNNNLILSSENSFLHDHKIALGKLNLNHFSSEQMEKTYQIVEYTAMLPSAGIDLNNYQLLATYLNQKTGKSYPLNFDKINLEINLTADLNDSIETDFFTKLINQGMALSHGTKNLDYLLQTIMRIHQFDPMMSNLKAMEKSLNYRLNSQEFNQKKSSELWYILALNQILQKDIKSAINSVKTIIKLEENNPYPYLYLASIYLYNWQVNQANRALKSAIKINPNLLEIKPIQALIDLMQGHFIKGWNELNKFNFLLIDGESL